MRHWPNPPEPSNGPIRAPWEIAVDVLGACLLVVLVAGVLGIATGFLQV